MLTGTTDLTSVLPKRLYGYVMDEASKFAYLALELCEAGTLAGIIATKQIPFEDRLRFCQEVCMGIADAHKVSHTSYLFYNFHT